MKWQRIAKSPRPAGFRPRLDVLEDRTLLTVVTFNIDPSSTLSLVGSSINYNGVPIPINEQAPGSLTTTQEGTIAADIDTDGGTINFLDAGTAIAADISGNWRPGMGGVPNTTDPANYGGQFSILFSTNYAAIRNNVNSLPTDAPVALTDQGGGIFTFPSNQRINVQQGTLDYETDPTLYGNGTTSIAGLPGQNNAPDGTLQDNGDGTFTLTAPVSGDVTDDLGGGVVVDIKVNGTITGTSSSPSTGSHLGGLAQAMSPHSTGSTLLPAASSNLVSLGAPALPATGGEAQAGVSRTQNQATALVHQGGTVGVDPLVVDAVFQDPLQGGL